MGLIWRSESDFLRISNYIDAYLHLTNAIGAANNGLSLVFREFYKDRFYEDYKKQCNEGKYHPGRIYHYKDKDKTKPELIHAITKYHYLDPTELNIVEKILDNLRNHLKDNPAHSIAMPLIGHINKDISKDVRSLHYQYLNDLPNSIHICMRPEAYEKQPLYICISGSKNISNRDFIKSSIENGLKEDGISLYKYLGFITGESTKIDLIVNSDKNSIADELFMTPVIIPTNYQKHGRIGVNKRNSVMYDIGSYFIFFNDHKLTVNEKYFLSLLKNGNKKYRIINPL